MGSQDERPAKRAKIGSSEVNLSGSKLKHKNNNLGKHRGVIDGFKSHGYTSPKKAISYSTLNREKEEKKKNELTKNLTGFIDLDSSDADVSFKVLRSSQEFNIDQVVSKSVLKSSPESSKVRPSSDDGIFWIDTSGHKESLEKFQNFDPKVSSSPLRQVYRGTRDDDDAFDLIDPDVKSMVNELKPQHENNRVRIRSKPDFARSKSDPRGLEYEERGSMKQIINRKGTIGETLLNEKLKANLHNHNHLDFANMLTQIGESLSMKQKAQQIKDATASETGYVKEPIESANILEDLSDVLTDDGVDGKDIDDVEVKITTPVDEGDNNDTSDDFSDDIDLDDPEVSKIIATQAPNYPTQNNTVKENQLSEDESDDTFSDDDELFEKAVDKMTQGFRSVSTRPNTDQTDGGYEIDTTETVRGMKNLGLNKYHLIATSKYKGLATVVEKNGNENSEKGFQLFDENDNLAKSALHYKLMKRLQIKEILENYKNERREYTLKCITADDEVVSVFVRDQWAELDFQVNDVIHIITAKEGDNYRIVNSKMNLLIWNPDILVSATNLAGSIDCKRRSVINQKFSGPGQASIPMIVGSITHELFQRCLLDKCTDDSFADEIIDEQISTYLIEIFSVSKTPNEVKEMIKGHFLYVKEWIEDYVGIGSRGNRREAVYHVSNILDIEQNIMSPIYGVRGIIDVVLETEINKGKYVVPMEIKTGTPNIANQVQALMYTLLVKQRYGVDSTYFSLVFTKTRDCVIEAVKKNDVVGLINLRNALSQYLVYGVTKMPPLLKRQSTCERCFVREPCMVLDKLVDSGTAEESGITADMYDEYTFHLSDERYKTFYTHWDELITKEEGLSNYVKRNLWCKKSKDREVDGGECVGDLKVVGFQALPSQNQYLYIFERDPIAYSPLNHSNIVKYDRIILSEENSTFGLAQGFVKLITSDTIVMITSKRWSDSAIQMTGFDASNNQTFMSVLSTQNKAEVVDTISDEVKSKKFRIDKDAISFGMSMARYNLLNLFMPEGDIERRELIVEHRTPTFSDTPNFSYHHVLEGLNEDQVRAVETVSKIEDYCLILGMPGTGKTTVISSIIECMVRSGKSVLISSHTHSAVDNICEKLIKNAEKKGEELPLLRVGNPSKISAVVQPFALHGTKFGKKIDSKESFEELVDRTQVVAVTCLGISDVIFGTEKRYDYCIIDEASQVSLPIVLGPLSFCDKFVLVGDHYQLPPLVRHPEAKNGGLDQSLFKILSDKHPQTVVELTLQYRMCEDIMSLSNELIYNGRLKCGSKDVAQQKLKIQNFELLPIRDTCIEKILDPEKRVVFVNGDDVKNIHEVIRGDKVDNPGEAAFVSALIKVLLLGGIQGEDIGVMSFYNAQLKHFYISLKSFTDIEILTADRFQGRDKDVIIISLVRTDALGDLLKEWRRFNVAITRARCKLIIFGSKKLLESEEQFEGFMEMIKEHNWVYDLVEGDDKVASEIEFSSAVSDALKVNTEAPAENTQTLFKGITSDSKAIQRTKLLKYILSEIGE
ncbi:hypothetical protein CANINC_001240 [Pichia inconspicua]|uniref:DNA replication ATP-dependent helicase/nuclease n=1 Tax=Pichia inconspicua TaxID=52247 RepID=A0A4T0X4Q1_9ASCO|nr:hypothetical protein CANINC_001240 [[Candida] inconspicua]